MSQRYSHAVVGFLVLYTLAWTAVSFLLDPSVPYDAVEALNWANNAEFGSPKNPYMVGWVMAAGLLLEPVIPISLYWYLSHFVGVAIGMLGVWLLSRRLFGNNAIALLALMSLNLSPIINFGAIPYNDNYLLVMFWPYIFLFFIKAVYDSPYHWCSLAVVAGLAAMSKYSTFAFMPFMFAYTLLVPAARKAYRSPLFYLAILVFLLLLAPNAVWLHKHHYAAFNWVQSQITRGLNIKGVVSFLSVFWSAILLSVILLLLGGKFRLPDTPEKRAILFVFTPPILSIPVYFSFNCGGRMTEWLEPFFVIAPAAVLSLLNVDRVKSLRRISVSFLVFSVVVCFGYGLVYKCDIGGAGSKYNYLKRIGVEINELWRERYHQPLRYVGGGEISHWLTFYAPDRPRITTPWSDDKKPNIYNSRITARDILDSGALFVSDPGGANLEGAISDFPGITVAEEQDYLFKNEHGQLVRLRLAFSPPRKQLPNERSIRKQATEKNGL